MGASLAASKRVISLGTSASNQTGEGILLKQPPFFSAVNCDLISYAN